MSVLTNADIRKLNSGNKLLIENFSDTCLEAASYDMRLGGSWAKSGAINILSDAYPSIVINPGQFILLTTYESLNMPNNLIGHNGIMSPWAKRGLVSLFSPQIDPGFQGILIVPVFNAGDGPISINFKDKIFTVEFVKTIRPVAVGWSDRYGKQDRIPSVQTPATTQPNIENLLSLIPKLNGVEEANRLLKKEVDELRSDLSLFKLSIVNDKIEKAKFTLTTKIGTRTLLVAGLTLVIGAITLIATVYPDAIKQKFEYFSGSKVEGEKTKNNYDNNIGELRQSSPVRRDD